MPLHMTFWGKEENREMVLDQLKKHGFKLGSTLKGKFDTVRCRDWSNFSLLVWLASVMSAKYFKL